MSHRFYHPHPLAVGETIALSKKELHHATKVLRIRPGEPVTVINGQGSLAKGILQDGIEVQSVETKTCTSEPKILLQAIPEFKHLEVLLEKSTELGIDRLILFPSAKSLSKEISTTRKERLEKISIAAIKQCKRLYLPEIVYCKSSKDVPDIDKLFLADPSGDAMPRSAGTKGMVVGPEAGLTEDEKKYWIEARGAKPIKLGQHVLRCETAAIISSYELCH